MELEIAMVEIESSRIAVKPIVLAIRRKIVMEIRDGAIEFGDGFYFGFAADIACASLFAFAIFRCGCCDDEFAPMVIGFFNRHGLCIAANNAGVGHFAFVQAVRLLCYLTFAPDMDAFGG